MTIRVNGRMRDVEAASVRELLLVLGYEPERPGIAVAVNGEVVRRGEWPEPGLREGDAVEIVAAVQGG